jgi:hypothetical protein
MNKLTTAQICAAISQIAYQKPGPAEKALKRLGMTWCKFYDVEGSEAVMCGDGYRVYVGFRGTNDFGDVLDDLNYVKVDFPKEPWDILPDQTHVFGCPRVGNKAFIQGLGGRVHKGFYDALMRIWPAILIDLRKLDPTLIRIYTGHSLGAAMALGANGSGLVVYRYENHLDPITFIPPRTSPRQIINSIRHGRKPTLYKHAGHVSQLPTWWHGMVHYRVGLDRLIERTKLEARHVHDVG